MSKSKKKSKHRLRLEQWIAEGKPCTICGLYEAINREHVPPRNIFLKPRPNNLVTVPACDNCNNDTSGLDEEFRAYLSLRVGIDNRQSLDFWTKAALPTIQSNERLRRQIGETLGQAEVFSEAGIFIGIAPAVLWEVQKHNPIIEKTVKGLYWEHYNDILGNRVNWEITWLRGLTEKAINMLSQLHVKRIGNAFVYAYRRTDDDPISSIWLLEFYGIHLVNVITRSK